MADGNPTYAELLRHPEWQKKRLRIMEAAGFACRECGADDRTLNVHHRYYLKGRKPWEYPDDALACLCEDCHERRHNAADQLRRLIGRLPGPSLEYLLGVAKGLALKDTDSAVREVEITAISEVLGLADVWGIRGRYSASVVLDALAERGSVDRAAMDRLRADVAALQAAN